jgi:hypothetical protein
VKELMKSSQEQLVRFQECWQNRQVKLIIRSGDYFLFCVKFDLSNFLPIDINTDVNFLNFSGIWAKREVLWWVFIIYNDFIVSILFIILLISSHFRDDQMWFIFGFSSTQVNAYLQFY